MASPLISFADIHSEPGTARYDDDDGGPPPPQQQHQQRGGRRSSPRMPPRSQQQQQQQQQFPPPLQHVDSGSSSAVAARNDPANILPSPSFFSSTSSVFSAGNKTSTVAPPPRSSSSPTFYAGAKAARGHRHSLVGESSGVSSSSGVFIGGSNNSGGNFLQMQQQVDASVFAWIVRCSLITSMPLKELNSFLTDSLRVVDKLIARAAEAALAAEAAREEQQMREMLRLQETSGRKLSSSEIQFDGDGSMPHLLTTPTNKGKNSRRGTADEDNDDEDDEEMQRRKGSEDGPNTQPRRRGGGGRQNQHHNDDDEEEHGGSVRVAIPEGIASVLQHNTSSTTQFGTPLRSDTASSSSHSNSATAAATATATKRGGRPMSSSAVRRRGTKIFSERKANESNNSEQHAAAAAVDDIVLEDPMSQVLFTQLNVFFEALRKLPPSAFRNLINNGEDTVFSGSVVALGQLWADSIEHMQQLQQLLSAEHQWQLLCKSAATVSAQAQTRFVLVVPDTCFGGNPVTESENVPAMVVAAFVVSLLLMVVSFFVQTFGFSSSSSSSSGALSMSDSGPLAMVILFCIGSVGAAATAFLAQRRFSSLRARLKSILSVVMHHLQQDFDSNGNTSGGGGFGSNDFSAVSSGNTFSGGASSSSGGAAAADRTFPAWQRRGSQAPPGGGISPGASATSAGSPALPRLRQHNSGNFARSGTNSAAFDPMNASSSTIAPVPSPSGGGSGLHTNTNSNNNLRRSDDFEDVNNSASAGWWLQAMPGGAMILPSKPNTMTSIAPATPIDLGTVPQQQQQQQHNRQHRRRSNNSKASRENSSVAAGGSVFRTSAPPVDSQARSAGVDARQQLKQRQFGGGMMKLSSSWDNEDSGSLNNTANSADLRPSSPNIGTSICLDMSDVHRLLFVVCFDYDFVVTQWNATAEELTGFLARECVGKKLQELMNVPEDVLHSLMNGTSSKRENVTVQVQSLNTGTSVLRGSMVPTFDAECLYQRGGGGGGGGGAQKGGRRRSTAAAADAAAAAMAAVKREQQQEQQEQEQQQQQQQPSEDDMAAAPTAQPSRSSSFSTLGSRYTRTDPVGFAFVSALQADDNSRATALLLNFKASMMRQTIEALSIECRTGVRNSGAVKSHERKTLAAENTAAKLYQAEAEQGVDPSEFPLPAMSVANQIRYVQSLRVLVRGSSWETVSHIAQYVQEEWEVLSPEQILSSAVRYSLSKVAETRCGGGNMELPQDLRVAAETTKIAKALVAACPGKARVLVYGQETSKGQRRLIISVESVAPKKGQLQLRGGARDSTDQHELSVSTGSGGAASAPTAAAASPLSSSPRRSSARSASGSGSGGDPADDDAVNAASIRSNSGHHGAADHSTLSDSSAQHAPPESLLSTKPPAAAAAADGDAAAGASATAASSAPLPFDFDALFIKVAPYLQNACGVLFASADARCVMLYLPCISSKSFIGLAGGGGGASSGIGGGEYQQSSSMLMGGGGGSPSMNQDVSGQWGSMVSMNQTLRGANLSFGGASPNSTVGDAMFNTSLTERPNSAFFGNRGQNSQMQLTPQQQELEDSLTAKTPIAVAILFDNAVDYHNMTNLLLQMKKVSVAICQNEGDLIARLPFVDLILIDWALLPDIEANKPVLKKQLFVLPCVDEGWQPDESMPEGIESQVVFRPFERAFVARKVVEASQLVLDLREREHRELERDRILQARNDAPWKRGRQLGKGAFGTVYEAINEMTGGIMAVKCFNLTFLRERAQVDADPDAFDKVLVSLTNEIEVMCKLSHPHIVHYFYCEQTESSLNLFMELCDRSLQDLISNRRLNRGLLEAAAPTIARQTLRAVAYLHERGVIHRDLKPLNILLRGDNIKLTDFGTAAQLSTPGEQLTETQGTFRYMAPEVYRGESYNEKCDIWSVGCIMAELLNLDLDFMDPNRVMFGPGDIESVELPPVSRTFSENARDFVLLCLQLTQEDRPLASALLLHPFVDLGLDGEEMALLSRLKGGERKVSGGANKSAAAAAAGGGSGAATPHRQGSFQRPGALNPLSPMAAEHNSVGGPLSSLNSPVRTGAAAGGASSASGTRRPSVTMVGTSGGSSGLLSVQASGTLNVMAAAGASGSPPASGNQQQLNPITSTSRSGSWKSTLSDSVFTSDSNANNDSVATAAAAQTTSIVVQSADDDGPPTATASSTTRGRPPQHHHHHQPHHHALSAQNDNSVNLASELGALAESDEEHH